MQYITISCWRGRRDRGLQPGRLRGVPRLLRPLRSEGWVYGVLVLTFELRAEPKLLDASGGKCI